MINKITNEDLLFFQTMSNPVNCAEILFSDFDNLGDWDKEKFGQIRLYQKPMLAFDSLFLEDTKLSFQQNFDIKNGLAEGYNLGGRLTGKTHISIIIDVLVAIFNKTFKWAVISSYDKLHVQEAFEKIIIGLENHPIMKMFNTKILRSPTYKITTDNGCLLQSVNMNITGKNPGGQFFGKHVDKHWMEESSMLNRIVSGKLLMSQSEKGCINRYSGMTDFTKESPVGIIFFNIRNKNKIINLPSYTNPTWNNKKEEDAILEFGGKDSPGYATQIDGKVIQGIESVFDILRIRETYITDKKGEGITIKSFDVNKESFHNYKEIIVIEKPNNAEEIGIYFDVGEGGAPSEYIIISKTNEIYKYIYRTTTFQLSPVEEEEFIDYLIELLEPNIVGLDHSSGVGKALYSHLIINNPDNIIPVDFYSNIEIGLAKDKNGRYTVDKAGNHLFEKANTVDWSIQCLKNIFYTKKIICYEDIKFDTQINNIVAGRSKQGKIMYGCKGQNHLFQAFQVFAICQWITESKNMKAINRKKLGMGVFG